MIFCSLFCQLKTITIHNPTYTATEWKSIRLDAAAATADEEDPTYQTINLKKND